MALTLTALKLLAPHIRGANVLCFGYPDILATPDEASDACGVKCTAVTPWPVKHKALAGAKLVDTAALFHALDARVLYIDSMPSRNIEMKVDLNEPLPVHVLDHDWSLVIDAGTVEHCANVGQALRSAAAVVPVGGRVFHSPPVSMLNHGFYNLCPTLLHDFYSQNGFHVEYLAAFYPRTLVDFSIVTSLRAPMPPEAALYFLARKLEVVDFRWPAQSKYGG